MSTSSPTGFPMALPHGTRIDHYEIIRVLGIGNFGVTYEAYSHRYHASCVVKELLPADYAMREATTKTIMPLSNELTDVFNHCRKDFQREATILHRIKHPNVMKVLDIFEANGTSYYVMPYARGTTFEEIITRAGPNGRIPEPELLGVLHGVLDGLECVHNEGYLHRDLKPENILINEAGNPQLIDFGAARQLIGSRSRPMSAILTRGYAPFEQYSLTQNQGPYSDLYALGAMFHRALVSELPPEAPDRMDRDQYRPLESREDASGYSVELRRAIDWALRSIPKERPQSVPEWRRVLPRPALKTPNPGSRTPPPLPQPEFAGQGAGFYQEPANGMRPTGQAADFDQMLKKASREVGGTWKSLPSAARLGIILIVPFFFIVIFLFVFLKLLIG